MSRICLGASISGTLFGDSNGNKQFDPTIDSPGDNRIVRLRLNGKEIATVVTDEKSEYEFCGLAAGTYELTRDYPKGFQMANPTKEGTNIIEVTLAEKEAKTVNIGSMAIPKKPDVVVVTPEPDPKPNNPEPTPSRPKFKGCCALSTIYRVTDIQSPYGLITGEALIKKWACTHTREWLSSNYRPVANKKKSDYDGLRRLKALGLDVAACFATEDWSKGEPTKASETRDCFNRWLDLVGDTIDYWEVGNEPNLPGYWPSMNAQKFVDLVGNPAYEVLSKAGKKVVSASVTYDVPFVKRLFDAGLKADMVGFHPYRETASALKKLMEMLVGVVGTKPIALTEWNTFLGPYYRANTQPKSKKAKFPAMSADTIVTRQIDSWNVLKAIPTVEMVSYFISHSPKDDEGNQWKHTTGPLELVDMYAKKTTPFSDNFFAKV